MNLRKLKRKGRKTKTVPTSVKSPEKLFTFGLKNLQAGRLHEAESSFARLVKIEPGHAQAWRFLGQISLYRGELAESLKQIEKSIDLDPQCAETYYDQGIVLRNMNLPELAIESFTKALQHRPDFSEASNTLGNIFEARGAFSDAEKSYLEAINTAPDNAIYYFNLGNLRFKMGENSLAVDCFRKAIELNPEYTSAHDNLGYVLHEMSKPELAIESYRRSLEINPKNPVALNNIASSFKAQGYLSEAEAHCRKALSLDNTFLWAHMNLGTILLESGRKDESRDSFRKCLELDPDNAVALYHLISCGKYDDSNHKDARELKRLQAIHEEDSEQQGLLHFAAGKIHDDCGNYDKAADHFLKANRIWQKTVSYDVDELASFVDDLITAFPKGSFTSGNNGCSESTLPVFIVGMPRSGTSLVEQMISSHPDGDGVGEVFWINNLAATLSEIQPYPKCIADISPERISGAASEYLDFLRHFTGNTTALKIANKTPANYLHLGLIALMFPQARFIHCTRDPRDIGLSLFSRYFPNIDYSYDLEDIAAAWLQQELIMDHWKSIPEISIFEISYEDLVCNFEPRSREVIKYIGLPWHEDCLNFFNNPRPVRTASAWQVRQPVYSSSVGRWKNYEKLLTPLIEKLGLHLD